MSRNYEGCIYTAGGVFWCLVVAGLVMEFWLPIAIVIGSILFVWFMYWLCKYIASARRAAEAKRLKEEEERRAAEAKRLKEEEERRAAEAKRRREEDAMRREEEARRLEEEVKRRREELAMRQAAEAKRRREEEAKRRAEQAMRQAAEAKRRREEEAKRREEEARRREEERLRLRKEHWARVNASPWWQGGLPERVSLVLDVDVLENTSPEMDLWFKMIVGNAEARDWYIVILKNAYDSILESDRKELPERLSRMQSRLGARLHILYNTRTLGEYMVSEKVRPDVFFTRSAKRKLIIQELVQQNGLELAHEVRSPENWESHFQGLGSSEITEECLLV